MPPRAGASGRRRTMYRSLCISLGRRPRPRPPPSPPPPPPPPSRPPRVGCSPGQPAFLDVFHGATNKDPLVGRRGSSSPRPAPATLAPRRRAGLGSRAGRRGRAGLAGARSSTDDLPLPARPSERRPSRVSGLGPHERQLRRGRGPREERRGFKGPHPTNPCHPAGSPRRAWPWGWLPAPRRPPVPSLARPRAPGKVGAAPPPSPAATTAPAQLREPLDPVRTLQTVSWRIRTTSAERDAGIKIGPTRRQIIKDGSKKKEERRKPAGEGRPSPLGRLPGGRAFCSSVPPPPAGPRPRPGEHVAICQALGRVSI